MTIVMTVTTTAKKTHDNNKTYKYIKYNNTPKSLFWLQFERFLIDC